MLIKKYAAVVKTTDDFSDLTDSDAVEIAILGLTSEIGSILSAVKKETLTEGGAISSRMAKAELKEELGDAMWYAFALARLNDDGSGEDVLVSDVKALMSEISKDDPRSERIRDVLPSSEFNAFFPDSKEFIDNPKRRLSDYQKLAFRTARTQGDTLLTVCVAVLTQLGAQLMRHLLPDIEKELNKQALDRPINVLLGEIAWHLCAIASLYGLDMDEVATANQEKVNARKNDGRPSELHDEEFPIGEQIPRQFEVSFQPTEDGDCQMYWKGDPLGDPLKDQHSEADGYRFHDVMHLANAAVLGWSPVLRDLMGIKRKSDPVVKQSEDGGRSAVLEELVVKLIHFEGAKRAKEREPELDASKRTLFPSDEPIPFSLLKQVRDVTNGHEVYKNKYWEWEAAIQEGYRVFEKLKRNNGGVVSVDLTTRKITFRTA